MKNAFQHIIRCDCRPGYLYHVLDNHCYETFSQGPCQKDEIFILIGESPIAKCSVNKCKEKDHIMFHDKCQKYNSREPCLHMQDKLKESGLPSKTLLLKVDPASFKLACIDEQESIFCYDYGCKSIKDNKVIYHYKLNATAEST